LSRFTHVSVVFLLGHFMLLCYCNCFSAVCCWNSISCSLVADCTLLYFCAALLFFFFRSDSSTSSLSSFSTLSLCPSPRTTRPGCDVGTKDGLLVYACSARTHTRATPPPPTHTHTSPPPVPPPPAPARKPLGAMVRRNNNNNKTKKAFAKVKCRVYYLRFADTVHCEVSGR
jgi:hypothetical protein